METEPIIWKFLSPPPVIKCMLCNETAKQAGKLGGFTLYLCEDCGKLTEGEILKRITEGI